jgi:hypothetical protein
MIRENPQRSQSPSAYSLKISKVPRTPRAPTGWTGIPEMSVKGDRIMPIGVKMTCEFRSVFRFILSSNTVFLKRKIVLGRRKILIIPGNHGNPDPWKTGFSET